MRLALLLLLALPTLALGKLSRSKLESMATEAANKYNVPPAILKGMIRQESNWNPDAKNSHSGAAGIMQFMEKTAEGKGMVCNIFRDDRYDPRIAMPKGAEYLAYLHSRFPEAKAGLERWRFALAAYNRGRGGLNKVIKNAGLSGRTGLLWSQVCRGAGHSREYVRKIMGESGPLSGYASGYGSYNVGVTGDADEDDDLRDGRGGNAVSNGATRASGTTAKCAREGGRCVQIGGSSKCGSGSFVKGLCGTGKVCCVGGGASKCDREGGDCFSLSGASCGGSIERGLCPGSSDVRCCKPTFLNRVAQHAMSPISSIHRRFFGGN